MSVEEVGEGGGGREEERGRRREGGGEREEERGRRREGGGEREEERGRKARHPRSLTI